MTALLTYIISPETAGYPPVDELDSLLRGCEWFAPARILRAKLTGEHDARFAMVAPWRAVSSLCMESADVKALTAITPEELIDRFLGEKDLRIVADEGDSGDYICTEAQLEDDDQIVSEPLAEIYLAQGLREEALSIYRRLSLLNPEKSVYFAELIARIENNN